MYRLDRGCEDELVEIIESFLRDNAPMVLSSAVAAFTEVCPSRLDLLHRHYRKLCCLLVDTDEWGQILLVRHFTFTSPRAAVSTTPWSSPAW